MYEIYNKARFHVGQCFFVIEKHSEERLNHHYLLFQVFCSLFQISQRCLVLFFLFLFSFHSFPLKHVYVQCLSIVSCSLLFSFFCANTHTHTLTLPHVNLEAVNCIFSCVLCCVCCNNVQHAIAYILSKPI